MQIPDVGVSTWDIWWLTRLEVVTGIQFISIAGASVPQWRTEKKLKQSNHCQSCTLGDGILPLRAILVTDQIVSVKTYHFKIKTGGLEHLTTFINNLILISLRLPSEHWQHLGPAGWEVTLPCLIFLIAKTWPALLTLLMRNIFYW